MSDPCHAACTWHAACSNLPISVSDKRCSTRLPVEPSCIPEVVCPSVTRARLSPSTQLPPDASCMINLSLRLSLLPEILCFNIKLPVLTLQIRLSGFLYLELHNTWKSSALSGFLHPVVQGLWPDVSCCFSRQFSEPCCLKSCPYNEAVILYVNLSTSWMPFIAWQVKLSIHQAYHQGLSHIVLWKAKTNWHWCNFTEKETY